MSIKKCTAAENPCLRGEYETSSVEKMNDILKKEFIRRSDPFLALQRLVIVDMRMYERRLSLCRNAKGSLVPRIKDELNKQAVITQD